jgi:hypothetical protein
MSVKPRTNLVLDVLIVLAFVVVLITGLAMSLGVVDGGGSGQRHGQNRTLETSADSQAASVVGVSHHDMVVVHEWASYALTALIGLHLIFHWKWIVCQVQQLLGRTAHRHPREKACAEA